MEDKWAGGEAKKKQASKGPARGWRNKKRCDGTGRKAGRRRKGLG